MKAAWFDYLRPTGLPDALGHLQSDEQNTKVMAGSQSLGPMLNMRLTRPERVIDVSGLESLQSVTTANSLIRIGAAVTHAQIEDGHHAALRGHPVQRVAGDIAYRAVRNRGTIGGSLAHADPAADWIVVLTAMNAIIHAESKQGGRDIAMRDFMHGAYTTALRADELITAVSLPSLAEDARWGYIKFCRKPGEFSHASAAVLFEPSSRTASIVLGALDGAPAALPELAATIAGQGGQAATRDALTLAVRSATDSNDAVQCKLLTVALERALAQAGITTKALA